MTSNSLAQRRSLPRQLGALLATTAILTSVAAGAVAQPVTPAYAPGGAVTDVTADASGYGGQLSLAMGGSRILRFDRPIGQVMVGNPKVGDVIPLGERTIYVLGKATGATSLTVMPRGGGAPLATLDVRVGYDVDNIRRAVREIMPGEPVDVTARGDGVVLTGMVTSSAVAARAAAIAQQYAPEHVVNLTTVRGAEQVMLSVRVSEVQRTALQQLGLNNFTALWDTTRMPPVGSQPEMFLLQPPVLNPDTVGNLVGHERSGDWTVEGLFDALEKHGMASTLAEPNLVALSGETAVFFAGGEFPVPVPQIGNNNNTITIEYKQYGVSIGFTPTVIGDTINLAVAPEVSALDPANSVVLQGFRIPGLTTRRAKTTVEMRNGQSFAIAGLIRREFTDNLKGVPGASRAPLFGALFRSTGYQNNETEVVIIITAHLAKPTRQENLVAPTDLQRAPSEAELMFSGTIDKPAQAARTEASLSAPAAMARSAPPQPAMAPQPAAASAPAAPVVAAVAPPPKPAPAPQPVAPAPAVAVVAPPKPVVAAQPAPVAAAPAPVMASAPAPKPIAPVPAVAVAASPKPVVAAQPAPVAAPAPVMASAPAPKPAAPVPAMAVAAPPKPVVAAPPSPAPVAASAPAPKPAAPVPAVAVATPPAKPAGAPQAVPAPQPVPVAMAPLAPLGAPAPKPAAAAPAPAAKPAASPAPTVDQVAALQPMPALQLSLAAKLPAPRLALDTPAAGASAATSAASR